MVEYCFEVEQKVLYIAYLIMYAIYKKAFTIQFCKITIYSSRWQF